MGSKRVRRLFASFAPKHYELSLEPNPETLEITGTVVVSGQKTGRPSQRLTFHQNGVKVLGAKITRHDKKGDQEITVSRINHHRTLHELRLHTAQMLYPGSYTVEMEFASKISAGMQGAYYSDYTAGGEQKRVVSTQFESHFARQAFPCIDEPEAKATFALSLISPASQAVIGNMPPKTQTTKGDKLHTLFETTPRMPTYLLAFVFGDLQSKETKSKNGVDVRVWATKAHRPEALDFALEVAARGLDFFEEYFDTPYPLPKCDHVAIPDFSSGAMENWGLITYREAVFLADPDTATQGGKEITAEVILHELSHQWFGNLVTMRWWDDLWLNESFANVMAFVAEDALYPHWRIWNTYIAADGLAALRRDSIAGVQAIKTDVRHPAEIGSIFDPSIVYAKGGRLINMLVQHLGQEEFRKGLKRYFDKHAYGNTTGDDLWQALSNGSDVAHIMTPWLERSGYPVIEVTQNGQSLSIAQTHFLMDPAKADPERRWPVPLLADSLSVPALLEADHFQTELPDSRWVRLNQGATGHYLVHYVNPEHAEAIAQQAAQKRLNPAERLALLNDSAMLARAGKQTTSATLQLLDHYKQEDEEPVWNIIALTLSDLRRFIDVDPSLEEPMRAFVRQLVGAQHKRLGWREKPGESSEDTKLRALIISLGVYAKHPAIVAEALKLFAEYKKDSAAVTSELRSVILGAAVRQQASGAFDYLLDLDENTTDTALKLDIMDALTATKNPAQAKTLLGRLKDGKKVRQHDVDRWLAYLLRNRDTRQLAWDWLREHWDWIEKTFASDNSFDYFPRYVANAFNTAQLLDEYRTFFEPLKKLPALQRSITLGIEEIENRVAWLQRDVAAVKQYFL
ncbi:MAG: M1 family metallopeptidase [Candidatus Saccharimonadales bacterium]